MRWSIALPALYFPCCVVCCLWTMSRAGPAAERWSTMQSVVQEGASLNHCVASYVDGMVNEEYAILFLRKKEDLEKSLVTLQVRDGRVVQARGQSNRAPTKEEQEAIDGFHASLEKQKELDLVEAA